MHRRSFFASLLALPFLGRAKPKPAKPPQTHQESMNDLLAKHTLTITNSDVLWLPDGRRAIGVRNSRTYEFKDGKMTLVSGADVGSGQVDTVGVVGDNGPVK